MGKTYYDNPDQSKQGRHTIDHEIISDSIMLRDSNQSNSQKANSRNVEKM